MGLIREGINEVIATTRNNAAPMGIICRGRDPHMVLFKGSHTAENVESEGWVVANFIFDPVMYVRCAFDDLPHEMFVVEEVGGLLMHRLSAAEAWTAYLADVEKKTEETLIVRLTPLREEVIDPVLHPVNRGFNSIIDATVHATRYIRTKDPWLLQLIEHHASLARKCGGAGEWEALDLLYRYIGKAA